MMPLRALVVLLAALASACASSGAVPRPFPGAVGTATPPLPNGQAIVETALALRGSPYRWGGSDPSGFDCSGFVQYVFARHGVTLPRETRDQFTVGTSIKRSELREGDLVFYSTVAKGPSHVGMAIGKGRFVHAPSERGVVRVERVDVPYWDRRFVGAKRLR